MGAANARGKCGLSLLSMLSVDFHLAANEAPRILCLGAHSDDIEIGAVATLLGLADRYSQARIDWVVFGAGGIRREEALASAEYCTDGFSDAQIEVLGFRDGHFPMQAGAIKEAFEVLKRRCEPNIIFTHYREDRHQDHRLISDMTWQTFRNHLIFEYEIPKYDGDLGVPSVFSKTSEHLVERKLEILDRFFATQRNKGWFAPETFSALMRLRGVECQSESGFAEAFYCRKLVLR